LKLYDFYRVALYWDYNYYRMYNYHIFHDMSIEFPILLPLGLELFDISQYKIPYITSLQMHLVDYSNYSNLIQYYALTLSSLDRIYPFAVDEMMYVYYRLNTPIIIYLHILFLYGNILVLGSAFVISMSIFYISIIVISLMLMKYIYNIYILISKFLIRNIDYYMRKRYDRWDEVKEKAQELKEAVIL